MLGFLFGSAVANAFEITKFVNETSVYFKQCGKAVFIEGKWNLFSYMDMQEYQNGLAILNQNMDKIRVHCGKNSSSICVKVIEEMENRLELITANDAIIKIRMNAIRKRAVSMAPFILSLLGTAIGYAGAKKVDSMLGTSEDHMVELLREQVSVVEVLKEGMIELETQNLDGIKASKELDWGLHYVSNSISKLYETQKILMSALNEGKLTAEWMKPNELLSQIELISESLPDGINIYGKNNKEKLLHIYQYAKISTVVTTRTFALVIEIPLTSDKIFTRFEVIPIAFQHDDHFIIPNINHKNIWLNEVSNIVYLPMDDETKNCLQTIDVVMCEQKTQMYSQLDICEMQLLKNTSASNCTYKEMDTEEEWRKLNKNQWLFSMKSRTQAEIKCEDNIEAINISDSGIMKFNTECSVKTRTAFIKSMKTISVSAGLHHTFQMHTLLLPDEIHIHEKKVMEKVQRNIENLKITDNFQFWHNCHHYVTIYCMIVLVPVIFIYFYKKLELSPIQ